jgi:hypothetical protein
MTNRIGITKQFFCDLHLEPKILDEERIKLTPDTGFDLVGIDFFADSGNQLYLIKHFEKYQEALNAKKERKNPDEYFVLYKDSSGEYLYR